MYRPEYFGYDGFMLPDLGNTLLQPHKHFRVYGVIHPYSECIVTYTGTIVRTIIVVDDKRYADEVLEEIRKTFRNLILIGNGGVVLWQICLWYLTF